MKQLNKLNTGIRQLVTAVAVAQLPSKIHVFYPFSENYQTKQSICLF